MSVLMLLSCVKKRVSLPGDTRMRGRHDANVVKVQVTVTLLIFRYVFICFYVYNVGNAGCFIITCIVDNFSGIKITQMNAVLINSVFLRISRRFECTLHSLHCVFVANYAISSTVF